jgi:hypothetical protein
MVEDLSLLSIRQKRVFWSLSRFCAFLRPLALTCSFALWLLLAPSPFGSYLLAEALLCKTSTVNLNLELLSHNVMGDIFKDWCIPQHDDESLSNPAAAWKVPPFTLSAFPEL